MTINTEVYLITENVVSVQTKHIIRLHECG